MELKENLVVSALSSSIIKVHTARLIVIFNQNGITVKSILLNEPVGKIVLRKYLYILDPTCIKCKIGEEYNGEPLSLEMDHIDGDSSNNILSNVRLMCHSQTPTFKFKNANNPKGAEKRKARYLKKIKIVPESGTP